MIISLFQRRLLSIALMAAVSGVAMAQDAASTTPLSLDAQAIKDAGIVLDTAATRTLSDELKAPGEVKTDAYSTVLVTPRVASLVLARMARLGDMVKAGQPLVALSSVQVAETQGALIVAAQDWQRIAALGKQAVSARRYNEAKVQLDQARAKLRAYGVSDGQISALLRKGSAGADGSFELLVPNAGRISTDEFLVGERVEPGRTLFTVVQEDPIWVVAQMAPADAEKVRSDATVRIPVRGEALVGKVVQRPHRTDERTRTVPVRIEVDNRRDLLHAGELVEVLVEAGTSAPQLAVPAGAIVLLQNQATIFIDTAKGQFEPVAVMTGETQDGWTVITRGLNPGDRYVRKGAFALKARLLRSQLGEQ